MVLKVRVVCVILMVVNHSFIILSWLVGVKAVVDLWRFIVNWGLIIVIIAVVIIIFILIVVISWFNYLQQLLLIRNPNSFRFPLACSIRLVLAPYNFPPITITRIIIIDHCHQHPSCSAVSPLSPPFPFPVCYKSVAAPHWPPPVWFYSCLDLSTQ